MKQILTALLLMFFSTLSAQAQSEIRETPLARINRSQISLLQEDSRQSTLTENITEAHETRRLTIPKLNEDQLGESLSRFRALHREASCVVQPTGGSNELSFKANWLLWADCSLEKAVSFGGQGSLAGVDPARLPVVFASFYEKKLVELSYTLSITSIEAVLPILSRGIGAADRVVRNQTGFFDSATWADRAASLDVELVPILPAVVDGNFLRIGKGAAGNTVRIRIRSRTTPPHP